MSKADEEIFPSGEAFQPPVRTLQNDPPLETQQSPPPKFAPNNYGPQWYPPPPWFAQQQGYWPPQGYDPRFFNPLQAQSLEKEKGKENTQPLAQNPPFLPPPGFDPRAYGYYYGLGPQGYPPPPQGDESPPRGKFRERANVDDEKEGLFRKPQNYGATKDSTESQEADRFEEYERATPTFLTYILRIVAVVCGLACSILLFSNSFLYIPGFIQIYGTYGVLEVLIELGFVMHYCVASKHTKKMVQIEIGVSFVCSILWLGFSVGYFTGDRFPPVDLAAGFGFGASFFCFLSGAFGTGRS